MISLFFCLTQALFPIRLSNRIYFFRYGIKISGWRKKEKLADILFYSHNYSWQYLIQHERHTQYTYHQSCNQHQNIYPGCSSLTHGTISLRQAILPRSIGIITITKKSRPSITGISAISIVRIELPPVIHTQKFCVRPLKFPTIHHIFI
jgi:hypothetical protein